MLTHTPVIKQPAEHSLLRFEFGQPAGVAIDTVVSTVITPAGRVAELAALTVDNQIVGQTYAQLRLAGGTPGELYAVSCLVEDASGNQFERDAEVLVMDLTFRAAGAQTSTYFSIEEFVARTGIDEAVRLTDETGAGVIDARRLDAALIDAQALVDSYLGARYQVPLPAPAPAPIPTLTFDIALARLWRGELPEDVKSKRDAAIAMLKDLSAGRAAIPVVPAPTQSSPTPVLAQAPSRIFSRRSLEGL